MSAQIAKANTLMLKLKESLKMKLPASFQTDGRDADGNPTLMLSQSSSAVAGQQNILIRIKADSTAFVDSIGQAQSVFSPHIIQSAEEESTITGVSLLTLAVRSKIDFCINRLGCKEEKYLSANTSVPALTDMVPANLQAKVADDYFPLSAQ